METNMKPKRGQEIPEDQSFIDQLFVAGQFRFQGHFLTLKSG